MSENSATADIVDSGALPNEEHVMHTFARLPIELVWGDGMDLFDAQGKQYVDFLAGIGTVNLGHSNRDVIEAMTDQINKLIHVSNFFYGQHRAELADKLVELFGSPAQVFFANSGAEAVEGALKLARKWGHTHKPDATTIVTAQNSFHGRTYGALTATGQPERAACFAPVLPGFEYIPLNDIEALDAALGEDTVAVMLEVIQGESGVWPATQDYLDAAQRLCKERNVLLMLDEVQTGIYRTGKPFAFQHYSIEPDIITSAKGLGNGYPIGAIIAREEVASTFVPGDHGSTFGGGPLACATARATLHAFDDFEIDSRTIEEHVDHVGAYAQKKLAEVACFTQVRGKGLMLGVTLVPDCGITAPTLRDELAQAGFIVNAIGDRFIRLLPPLICMNMHIDALVEAVNAIMGTPDKEDE